MPIYSEKLQKAITLALKVHWTDDKQFRKGDGTPYVTHPLVVALILAKAGADEDTIVGGILHDTIEDRSNDDVTIEYIRREYGDKSAEIVENLTEPSKELFNWDQRKNHTIQRLSVLGKDTLMVKTADLLHNMSQDISRFRAEGKNCFDNFNAPIEKQKEKFNEIYKALESSWSENPLLPDLKLVLDTINSEWK